MTDTADPSSRSEIDDATALGAYRDWNSAVNSLWTIYSGAAVAFGTVAAKMPQPTGVRDLRIALAVLFLVFAAGNASALWRAQLVCAAVAGVLGERAALHPDRKYRALLLSVKPSKPMAVVIFQGILSFIIAGAIVLLPQVGG